MPGISGKVPGFRSLINNFEKKVCRGNPIYSMLCVTNTGTGFNVSTGNHIGMCVLDSSSANWFLCTATAGTGTWVAINA